MKCPYCGSKNIIGIEIVGPYLVEYGKKKGKIPREIRYFCSKCKKGFSNKELRDKNKKSIKK